MVGPSADFVPVVVQPGETLATLAEKYLRDPDKRWIIADFNEVTSVSAGQEILIPLQAKARGGLSPIGYQTVPILTYHNFSETKQDLMMVRKDSFEQQMNYLASNGYTVVDPATVVSTHMSELIKNNAEELLTRQEVQALIDKIKNDFPVIITDVEKVANIGLIQRVLKALLHEKIPLKDMLTILETIADIAEYTKNVELITEQVRAKLSRVITQMYSSQDGVIRLLTFDTNAEQLLLQKSQEQDGSRNLMLNVGEINALIQATSAKAAEILQKGISPVIVIVDPQLRRGVAEIFERFSLDVVVLSHAEIDSNATFEVLGSITIET